MPVISEVNSLLARLRGRRYHPGRKARVMRRIICISILGFAGVVAMFAQRGGGGHGGGGGFHGGGAAFHGSAGVGFRGGAGGFRGNFGFRNNFAFRGNRFFGFSPFFYSGFYGGYPFWDPFFDYSDYGYGYGYPPDYGYASYGGGYGSGAPSVIINQGYAPPPPPAPMVRDYTAPVPPPPTQAQSNEPPLYLLAFQDGVIRAVLAYWVDGATLHYVSMEHEQKQVPLTSVDRMLSERLNRERNVTFQLPR
jgi:hypothetical protein